MTSAQSRHRCPDLPSTTQPCSCFPGLSGPAQLCLVQLSPAQSSSCSAQSCPAFPASPSNPASPSPTLPTMPWPALSSLAWDYPNPAGSKEASFLQTTYSFFLYNESIVKMNKWLERRRLRGEYASGCDLGWIKRSLRETKSPELELVLKKRQKVSLSVAFVSLHMSFPQPKVPILSPPELFRLSFQTWP